MKLKEIIKTAFLWSLATVLFASCTKNELSSDPVYQEGPRPEIKFSTDKPLPSVINAGGEVTFYLTGLKGKEGDFTFSVGDVETEILSITENSITVKTNDESISGAASVNYQGQVFYGPYITVRGLVNIDPSFNIAAADALGSILGILPLNTNETEFYVYGSFLNYGNVGSTTSPVNGIAKIDDNGVFVPGQSRLLNRAFQNSTIYSMKKLSNGQFIVAGNFSAYDTLANNLGGLALLESDGVIALKEVSVANPNPEDEAANTATVPVLNAIMVGEAINVFPVDDQYLVAGNFLYHGSVYWEGSTETSPVIDFIRTRGNVRIGNEGAFDSTYNYDYATDRGGDGANGIVLNAIKLDNNDLILSGIFAEYNAVPVGRIVKLKATDGSIDESFNKGGANGDIISMHRNEATNKILVAGRFSQYNGEAVNGVVMINSDGSIDHSFKFRAIKNGVVNFAKQLTDGTIVVTGTFTHYDEKVRPGIVFLNPDGSMKAGYNNLGAFQGIVRDIHESTTNSGKKSLYLVGSFSRFDNKRVSNIIKVILD